MVRTNWPTRAVLLLVAIAGLAVMVTPFVFMVSTSLSPDAYSMAFPPRLLPAQATFANYIHVWHLQNFSLAALNTLWVAVLVVAGVLFFSSLTAYAFARFQFPGKEFIFQLLLLSMMIPEMVRLIPTFLVMRDLHLLNSLNGLALLEIAFGVAGNTFMLRLFFQSLPRELEESVRVDGGNNWTVFRTVIVPLSQPALAVVGIWTFMAAWDNYFWPLILIHDKAKSVLPIALQLLHGSYATNWALIFAASLLIMIPELIIYVSFQRFFFSGALTGAIKG